MAASFLLRFQERARLASGREPSFGTETLTETREGRDQDRQLSLSTQTVTYVRQEAVDTDPGPATYRAIPLAACITMTGTRAREEMDQDAAAIGTMTATGVREAPDQDASNRVLLAGNDEPDSNKPRGYNGELPMQPA
jgi:hypothetical protein